MALTAEEKALVTKMLDEVERDKLQIILASLKAFVNWLKNTVISIYHKVKNNLESLWQSICNIFS